MTEILSNVLNIIAVFISLTAIIIIIFDRIKLKSLKTFIKNKIKGRILEIFQFPDGILLKIVEHICNDTNCHFPYRTGRELSLDFQII